jgi:hypothetical protein
LYAAVLSELTLAKNNPAELIPRPLLLKIREGEENVQFLLFAQQRCPKGRLRTGLEGKIYLE